MVFSSVSVPRVSCHFPTVSSGSSPGSNRKSKPISGVYLMENIQCTGVLIECGFLSNPREEARLRNAEYQKKLCCVIGATLSQQLSNT